MRTPTHSRARRSLMSRPGRSLWRLPLLGSILALAGGCAADSAQLNNALLPRRHQPPRTHDLATHYYVYSPDVLDVSILGRPDWSGPHRVQPDGRITLGGVEFPRVDGRTVAEIAHLVAEKSVVPENQVEVHVAEFNSQHLYV